MISTCHCLYGIVSVLNKLLLWPNMTFSIVFFGSRKGELLQLLEFKFTLIVNVVPVDVHPGKGLYKMNGLSDSLVIMTKSPSKGIKKLFDF